MLLLHAAPRATETTSLIVKLKPAGLVPHIPERRRGRVGCAARALRKHARLIAGLFIAGPGFAKDAATAPTAADAAGPITILPKMTVVEQILRDYPLFRKADVTSANFSDTSVPIDMFYPGEAYTEGVNEGNAEVGVMLDAQGRPTDYLLIRYTRRYFGDALMREAHRQVFQPRRIKGVAVAGRFNFAHRFAPTLVLQMTSFNAIEERATEIEGGPHAIYEPRPERDIDGGGLKIIQATVAFIPDGYDAPKGKGVRAYVSFYVDEQGHTRLPNVEGAASTLLVPNAIKAVQHWEFRPPTLMGKPVLVFAVWSVAFEPFDPLAPAVAGAPKP